jgi:hypothetical protein
MPDSDIDTEITQMPDHRVVGDIRTTDVIIQIMKYLGNATHSSTTDANEMNVANASHEVL